MLDYGNSYSLGVFFRRRLSLALEGVCLDGVGLEGLVLGLEGVGFLSLLGRISLQRLAWGGPLLGLWAWLWVCEGCPFVELLIRRLFFGVAALFLWSTGSSLSTTRTALVVCGVADRYRFRCSPELGATITGGLAKYFFKSSNAFSASWVHLKVPVLFMILKNGGPFRRTWR